VLYRLNWDNAILSREGPIQGANKEKVRLKEDLLSLKTHNTKAKQAELTFNN